MPEAVEQDTWADAIFRVRNKIFAIGKETSGGSTLTCKAPPGSQAVLMGADPHRFFVPPYVGHKGWVGVRLDRGADWEGVTAVVRRSYGLVAPKALAAQLESSAPRLRKAQTGEAAN